MKYDTVLKGGLVLDPLNQVRKVTDIAMRDGKIACLGENLSGEMTWDVTGKAVFPGDKSSEVLSFLFPCL